MCLNLQAILLVDLPAFNALYNLHKLFCEVCQSKESHLEWTPSYTSASWMSESNVWSRAQISQLGKQKMSFHTKQENTITEEQNLKGVVCISSN